MSRNVKNHLPRAPSIEHDIVLASLSRGISIKGMKDQADE